MTPLRAAGLAAALFASVLAPAACSHSSDGTVDAPPHDDGTTLPPGDASVADASPDAEGADAEAGPPRVCSEQNFCHTTVPAGHTLRAGWSDADGIAWAVSTEGAILRWDGKNWAIHASGLGALSSIWGSSPTDVWVGSETGLYHGQGASSAALAFTAVTGLPGDPTPITAVWGTGPDDVWATGPRSGGTSYAGRVLHYAGAAAGWSLDLASAEPIAYTRVWGSTNSGVWLAGVRKNTKDVLELAVRRRPVGKSSFSEVLLPGDPEYPPNNVYAKLVTVWSVSSSGDDTIWILGEQAFGKPGYVRGTTTDSGQTYAFTFTALGDKAFLLPNTIWGISANDAWVGGDFGRLRHFDGTTWKQAFTTITEYPMVDPLYGIWTRGTDELWIVGAGVALHRSPTSFP